MGVLKLIHTFEFCHYFSQLKKKFPVFDSASITIQRMEYNLLGSLEGANL